MFSAIIRTVVLKIQKLDFLISFYIGCIAVSELMGAKTTPLAHFGTVQLNASVAFFIVPLIYSINDSITEVFGKDRAQSVVRSGLLVVLFFFLFSLFAVHLSPTKRFLPTEKAYEQIFEVSARISAASLIAFAFGEFLDVYLFSRLRQKFGKKALWIRTNVSNILAQFIDTFLFITLAFYVLDKSVSSNFGFLFSLILPYWLLKCAMSFVETPIVYLLVNWLRKEK